MMWNMYIIEGLCFSSWFSLYFKDHGVSLYKDPIPSLPPPPQEFSWFFFPSTSLTFYQHAAVFFTIKPYWIQSSYSGLVLGEKTQTLKQ